MANRKHQSKVNGHPGLPDRTNGGGPGHSKPVTANHGSAKDEIPGGKFSLPADPGEFIEEIHSRIDLFEVWLTLLRSKDDKIKQRAVEKLTEMCYKGAAALADEPQRIVIDMPRPDRD